MTGQGNGKPKVALVVGAGAIKCAAAIGVHKVLEDAGIGVDHTIFAKVTGKLVFTEKGAGRFISVVPEA